MTRIALDLFGGTGGATAAFKSSLDWKVIRVDNDIQHAPDIHCDVRTLPTMLFPNVDFLWASPPCQQFSTMPVGSQHRRPSLELVFATFELIRDLRPRFWIIENVRGAIPFLGLPRQKIGPFCLWGYFPKIRPPIEAVDYRKMTPDKKNAVERAAIPFSLSLAVRDAVERSWDKKQIADLRPYRRHRQIAKLNRSGQPWRPS